MKTKKEISPEILEKSVARLVRILGKPDRTYKDQIFRMLLNDRKTALEVYNAMNGTDYANPEDLIITTLENAIYLGMKNDVSFIIDWQLVLYEHQSTVNPNMPIRDLFYVACVFSTFLIETNFYSRKLIELPEPQFVVFYNGVEEMPERWEMRLSDAYKKKSGDVSLELKVQVININPGYNHGLMEKSPTLYQYMQFVECVRNFQKMFPFEAAIEMAIDECIEKGILAEFLRKNRAEVLRMCLFEYDQEKHLQQERDDSKEEGRKEGMDRVNRLVELLLSQGRQEDLKRSVTDHAYQEKLMKEFGI